MSDVFPNYQNQKPMQLLKSNTMDEFANIVFVSKWIVLEHEICHVNYSKDSKIKTMFGKVCMAAAAVSAAGLLTVPITASAGGMDMSGAGACVIAKA